MRSLPWVMGASSEARRNRPSPHCAVLAGTRTPQTSACSRTNAGRSSDEGRGVSCGVRCCPAPFGAGTPTWNGGWVTFTPRLTTFGRDEDRDGATREPQRLATDAIRVRITRVV